LGLAGRIIKKGTVMAEARLSQETGTASFGEVLEALLLKVCRELDISVPIWLGINTKDLAIKRRTSFYPDQFIDKIKFDRFEIILE